MDCCALAVSEACSSLLLVLSRPGPCCFQRALCRFLTYAPDDFGGQGIGLVACILDRLVRTVGFIKAARGRDRLKRRSKGKVTIHDLKPGGFQAIHCELERRRPRIDPVHGIE